jgi:hypothetical protein
MYLKGQSSVEFLGLVIIVSIISFPFIIASQNAIIELDSTSKTLTLEKSFSELKYTSAKVRRSDYPSRRLISFVTPKNVDEIYELESKSGKLLLFETNLRGDKFNNSLSFEDKTNITNIERLSISGRHDISVQKQNRSVKINVVN